MSGYVGVAAYFARPLCDDDGRVRKVASLLLDGRWPSRVRWASFSGAGDHPGREAARLDEVALVDGLLDPAHARVLLERSSNDADNFARVTLSTGRVGGDSGYDDPFELTGFVRANAPVDDWIALVHELVAVLGADHALLAPWPSQTQAMSDTSLMRMVLDRGDGDVNLGVPGSAAEEQTRIALHRKQLGKTYARAPRWGTYLHAGHVAAIGGVDKIAEVEPTLIATTGELTYVQLTDGVASALTPIAEAKRARLETLMAPILVP
jgi:hypothetical protein